LQRVLWKLGLTYVVFYRVRILLHGTYQHNFIQFVLVIIKFSRTCRHSIIQIFQKFSIYHIKFRVYLLFVAFNHKNCIVEWVNSFFKSSPLDEYHLPQMNFKKNFFLGVRHRSTLHIRPELRPACRSLAGLHPPNSKTYKSLNGKSLIHSGFRPQALVWSFTEILKFDWKIKITV
jgi:hypothetical protein